MKEFDPRSAIRRQNARLLSASVGGPAAFARRLEMNDSQVSQIIGNNPKKNIGNIIARRIEEEFNLPRGLLDVEFQQGYEFNMVEGIPVFPENVELPPIALRLLPTPSTVPLRAPVAAPAQFYIDPEEVAIINRYRSATVSGKMSIIAASIAAERDLSLLERNEN